MPGEGDRSSSHPPRGHSPARVAALAGRPVERIHLQRTRHLTLLRVDLRVRPSTYGKVVRPRWARLRDTGAEARGDGRSSVQLTHGVDEIRRHQERRRGGLQSHELGDVGNESIAVAGDRVPGRRVGPQLLDVGRNRPVWLLAQDHLAAGRNVLLLEVAFAGACLCRRREEVPEREDERPVAGRAKACDGALDALAARVGAAVNGDVAATLGEPRPDLRLRRASGRGLSPVRENRLRVESGRRGPSDAGPLRLTSVFGNDRSCRCGRRRLLSRACTNGQETNSSKGKYEYFHGTPFLGQLILVGEQSPLLVQKNHTGDLAVSFSMLIAPLSNGRDTDPSTFQKASRSGRQSEQCIVVPT
jgi:hypothetical protein